MREVIKITQKDIIDVCIKYINEYSDKGISLINEQQSTYFDVNQLDNIKQVDNFDKVYSYAKGYDSKKKIFRYAFKRQGDLNWKEVTQAVNPKAYTAIKQNVFKEKPTATKTNSVLKSKVPVQQPNPFTQDLSNKSDTYAPIQNTTKLNAESSITRQAILKDITNTRTVPLHIKCMMWFLAGRSTTLTQNELTEGEKIFLWNSSINVLKLKRGFNYNYWKSVGAAGLPLAITQAGIKKESQSIRPGIKNLIFPNIAGQMMYTLGEVDPSNIKISPDKNIINIYDNYDMNTIEYKMSKEGVINNFKETLIQFAKGDAGLYNLIRKIVQLRELTGYNGFPINFTLTNPNTPTFTPKV